MSDAVASKDRNPSFIIFFAEMSPRSRLAVCHPGVSSVSALPGETRTPHEYSSFVVEQALAGDSWRTLAAIHRTSSARTTRTAEHARRENNKILVFRCRRDGIAVWFGNTPLVSSAVGQEGSRSEASVPAAATV